MAAINGDASPNDVSIKFNDVVKSTHAPLSSNHDRKNITNSASDGNQLQQTPEKSSFAHKDVAMTSKAIPSYDNLLTAFPHGTMRNSPIYLNVNTLGVQGTSQQRYQSHDYQSLTSGQDAKQSPSSASSNKVANNLMGEIVNIKSSSDYQQPTPGRRVAKKQDSNISLTKKDNSDEHPYTTLGSLLEGKYAVSQEADDDSNNGMSASYVMSEGMFPANYEVLSLQDPNEHIPSTALTKGPLPKPLQLSSSATALAQSQEDWLYYSAQSIFEENR